MKKRKEERGFSKQNVTIPDFTLIKKVISHSKDDIWGSLKRFSKQRGRQIGEKPPPSKEVNLESRPFLAGF